LCQKGLGKKGARQVQMVGRKRKEPCEKSGGMQSAVRTTEKKLKHKKEGSGGGEIIRLITRQPAVKAEVCELVRSGESKARIGAFFEPAKTTTQRNDGEKKKTARKKILNFSAKRGRNGFKRAAQ